MLAGMFSVQRSYLAASWANEMRDDHNGPLRYKILTRGGCAVKLHNNTGPSATSLPSALLEWLVSLTRVVPSYNLCRGSTLSWLALTLSHASRIDIL